MTMARVVCGIRRQCRCEGMGRGSWGRGRGEHAKVCMSVVGERSDTTGQQPSKSLHAEGVRVTGRPSACRSVLGELSGGVASLHRPATNCHAFGVKKCSRCVNGLGNGMQWGPHHRGRRAGHVGGTSGIDRRWCHMAHRLKVCATRASRGCKRLLVLRDLDGPLIVTRCACDTSPRGAGRRGRSAFGVER